MGKKKKQRVPELSNDPVFIEEPSEDEALLFEEHINSEDWRKISQRIQKKENTSFEAKRNKKEKIRKMRKHEKQHGCQG